MTTICSLVSTNLQTYNIGTHNIWSSALMTMMLPSLSAMVLSGGCLGSLSLLAVMTPMTTPAPLLVVGVASEDPPGP